MKIKIAELKNLIDKALKKYGYNAKEISTISEILLYAQLRDNNQGITKLIGKGIPKNPAAGKIKIIWETKLSVLLDGNKNMGMLVLKEAMEKACKKAKQHGFGIAGTNNTSTSTGALGYYAKEIARKGLIGFVFAGSPETVCTHGSYQPIYGTNPIAISVPSSGDPVVLDMATAAMAFYGLIAAQAEGSTIPVNVAYDCNGKLTTDPARALDGAILPFDRNYKGSGLAMMVEILTGPLVGAAFTGIGDPNSWGNLVMAIDPGLLIDKKVFMNNISRMTTKIKSTKKLPGVNEILVPGERGNKLTKSRLKSGTIEITDKIMTELKSKAL